MKILWVDDDFGGPDSLARTMLSEMYKTLKLEINDRTSLPLELRTKSSISPPTIEDLLSENYELIILDLQIDSAPKSSSNRDLVVGGRSLMKMFDALNRQTPVIILSNHIQDNKTDKGVSPEDYQFFVDHGNCIGAFSKSRDNIEKVAELICSYFESPPIRIVAFSDLHFGYAQNVRDEEKLFSGIKGILSEESKRKPIDYLAFIGDFAWKDQKTDIKRAGLWVRELTGLLNISDSSRLLFCPGNHDYKLDDDARPWLEFSEFVREISATFPDIPKRFYAARTFGDFRGFNQNEDIFSFHQASKGPLSCISFNSIRRDANQNKFYGEIGADQLELMELSLNNSSVRPGEIIMALSHYPVFQTPRWHGSYREDRPVRDQAEALFALSKHNVQLLLTGHSHFSGVAQYVFDPIGIPGLSFGTAGKPIINISLPTVGATPHDSTPLKQFFVIDIDRYIVEESLRNMRVYNWVYVSSSKEWVPGWQSEDEIQTYLIKC